MKLNKLVLSFSLFFISLISFGIAQASLSPTQKNDAQILKTLIQINTNEIDAAKIAEKRANNPEIQGFAEMMIKDHSQNRTEVKSLAYKMKIIPRTSDQSKALKQKGKKELKKLKLVSKANFDKTYMQAMVKGHQEALNIIDNDFLPTANDPELKQLLTATRTVVFHHLQVAKDILNKL